MDSSSKTAFIRKYGDYNRIEVEPQPLPPLEGKVEVQVKVCGMNFADIYQREGLLKLKFPHILGMECAGIVTAIDKSILNVTGKPPEEGKSNTTNLKVGQKVICYDYNGGLYTDRLRIDPKKCYPFPDHLSFETAAALFVNYLTAYFALIELGNVKPSEEIFVKSCAGGVGCAVTQLAKLDPTVKVYGTASKGKEDFAKENGVDFVFNYDTYEKECTAKNPNGFDIIIENEVGASYSKMIARLKPLGRLISLGANDLIGNNKRLTFFKTMKFFCWEVISIDRWEMMMKSQVMGALHLGNICEQVPDKVQKALDHLFKLLDEGKITPKIDSVWHFEKIREATKILVERRNKGKVLLTMDEEEEESQNETK